MRLHSTVNESWAFWSCTSAADDDELTSVQSTFDTLAAPTDVNA